MRGSEHKTRIAPEYEMVPINDPGEDEAWAYLVPEAELDGLLERLASAQEALRKIVKLGGQGYALTAADVARDALAQNPATEPRVEIEFLPGSLPPGDPAYPASEPARRTHERRYDNGLIERYRDASNQDSSPKEGGA